MLEDYLTSCGLNSTEAKVLLFLVRQGTCQAGRISKATGLKRPNVYAVLESLQNQGLVSKQARKAFAYFSALPPQTIPRVLTEHAKREYEETSSIAALMAPQLQALSCEAHQNFVGFEVSTVEGREAVMLNLQKLLLEGHFCAVFNPQLSIPADFKPMIADYLRQSAQHSPPIREIMVAGPQAEWYRARIRNKNHLVRTIAAEEKVLSDMIFHQGTVSLLHYEHGSEVAFRITHYGFYSSMMTTFNLLWDSLS